jgi:putative chitinase
MKYPSKFFASCRMGIMGPTLDNKEVSGANAILDAMLGLPIAWCAYALATAWHETAHTMQPIKEYGGDKYFTRMYDITGNRPTLAKRMGNTDAGDGPKYCGRGYVQLTWKANYIKASEKLGIDLVGNPDFAMDLNVAADILRHGMRNGWFTGKSFQSYLPASGPATAAQFQAARRIINGVDKSALIAGYAVEFQKALQAGEWET